MKNVIMIGNLSYNVNLFINSLTSQNGKYPIIKKTKTLGNILNIAMILSKYDLDVWYFSIIGDDIEGKEIINNLHSNRIHSDYVNILNNTKTNKNYTVRNMKNNTKTIFYERNNYKYELLREINFNVDVVYTDSSNYELCKLLKEKDPNTKLIITIDKLDEETINICKIADVSKRLLQIILISTLGIFSLIFKILNSPFLISSSTKLDIANKKSIIDLYMKTNKLFSATIIIYDERLGSLYLSNNRLNIVPKLGDKNLNKESSFDVYKSTFICSIANEFDLDKTVKLSCISKFLYDNNKLNFDMKEVVKIYEQNN